MRVHFLVNVTGGESCTFALAEKSLEYQIDSIYVMCRSRSALLEGDIVCPETWRLSASPSVAVCFIQNPYWRARFVGCMTSLCMCMGKKTRLHCMASWFVSRICYRELWAPELSDDHVHVLAIWNKKRDRAYRCNKNMFSNLGTRSKSFYMRAWVLWLKP